MGVFLAAIPWLEGEILLVSMFGDPRYGCPGIVTGVVRVLRTIILHSAEEPRRRIADGIIS